MTDIPTSPGDIDLFQAPLAEVAERLRADLAAIGQDKRCGECERPFTTARPADGLVRHVAYSATGASMVHYLVCRSCAHKARQREAGGGCVTTDRHRALAIAPHVGKARP